MTVSSFQIIKCALNDLIMNQFANVGRAAALTVRDELLIDPARRLIAPNLKNAPALDSDASSS
jgi:hypothetical protein